MADRTVPRLPRLPELTKLQALLLLGGAFVFVAAIHLSLKYRLVVDRTPAAPNGSVLAATILDRRSEDWLAFEAKLPERARQALSNASDLKSVTLFAVPGQTGPEWGLIEALSAETERTGRKKIRLVSKGTSVVGYLSLGGREVPFEASVVSGLIQARVGLDFRGPSFDSNPFAKGRRQFAPLSGQTAYVEKPSGVSWGDAAELLASQLQRFQPQADLWSLPGRMELSLSASETYAVSPFVLYYRPEYGGSLDGPKLETYAKSLLAESAPVGFEVTMPDDTQMIELRLDPDSVLTVRKKVNLYGERAQMKAPGGEHRMEVFYANDGEAWLSNDLDLIHASIAGNVSAERPVGPCEVGGRDGFVALSGKNLSSWPIFSEMDRLTFSIHSMESGLFTTCGYFTP